jgi:uncharacterized protein (DUF58 family)
MHSPREFIDAKVISRLMALPLLSRQPMLGNVSGKHRSPVRGSSIEFAAYRKYVPGDDTRRLDWRAYARSDRYFIKEFEADTNLRMCLILDTSGSMGYRAGGLSKFEFAQRIAGTLAYLAARQGDAVGLFLSEPTSTREIPARRSASHLRAILDQIGGATPGGSTGLAATLHAAAERVPQRALMIIISDLFLPPNELGSCFQHLRFRKHDVAVFHLLEKAEIQFNFDRPVRFVDLENGPDVLADPSVMGAQYRKAVAEYLADLTRVVRDARVDYQRSEMETNYEDVLTKFLLARLPKKAK